MATDDKSGKMNFFSTDFYAPDGGQVPDSAQPFTSTNAADKSAADAGQIVNTASVRAALTKIKSASTELAQEAGVDTQVVREAETAVEIAESPGSGQLAQQAVQKVETAVQQQESKVTAAEAKKIQESLGQLVMAIAAPVGLPAAAAAFAGLAPEYAKEVENMRASITATTQTPGAREAGAASGGVAIGGFGWGQYNGQTLPSPATPGTGAGLNQGTGYGVG